jgi:hypothetical protein
MRKCVPPFTCTCPLLATPFPFNLSSKLKIQHLYLEAYLPFSFHEDGGPWSMIVFALLGAILILVGVAFISSIHDSNRGRRT